MSTVESPGGRSCRTREPILLGHPRPRVARGEGEPAPMPVLNVAVRSSKMLDLQIAAGADEVFLGVRAAGGVSFDSLPASRDGHPTQVPGFSVSEELARVAHEAGLSVHLCADAPVVAARDRKEYLEHVRSGLEAGADTVVVGSPAACVWVAEALPEARLVAGAGMSVNSTGYAEHLRDTYGVERVVLPSHVALDEIVGFTALPGLSVEVCVQTGSGLDCSSCRISDLDGIGLGCRAGYVGAQAGRELRDLGAFLDGASDCALCDVPTLADLGVAAVQVVGRESPNLRQNAKVTQLYRRALDGHRDGVEITETIARIDRTELMWQMGWVPRLCEQQRCRFRDTPRQRTYV